MVLGQFRALLVGTWRYWISVGRYWLVHCGTGSVQGGTGWYSTICSVNCAKLSGAKFFGAKLSGFNY